MAEVMRAGANPCSPFLDQGPQANPLQLTHAVRRYEYACAHLTEGRGLLIDGYPQALRDERVRREQSANATADDDNAWPRIHHATPQPETIDSKLLSAL
jgi:hypothetical protein